MKQIITLLVILAWGHILAAQSVTVGGGPSPNGLRGTHFNATFEWDRDDKFFFVGSYQMIKYTDNWSNATRRPAPSLHQEYREDLDQAIIPFDELDRGIILQESDAAFVPRDFYHRFGFLLGYRVFEWRDFELMAMAGPHFSLNRSVLYNFSFPNTIARITLPGTDEPVPVEYHDYQIYRDWSLGPTVRADLRYSVFDNVALGIHHMYSADLLAGGWDLVWGGSLTFNFSTDEK